MTDINLRNVKVGDEVVRLTKSPISKEQLVRYAGASGDFNLLHTDDETAKKAGFEGVVAHGMLVMGFVAQAVTTWAPQRFLRKINVRFKAITFAGDSLTVIVIVRDKTVEGNLAQIVCSIEVTDQNNQVKAIGSGEIQVPLGSQNHFDHFSKESRREF